MSQGPSYLNRGNLICRFSNDKEWICALFVVCAMVECVACVCVCCAATGIVVVVAVCGVSGAQCKYCTNPLLSFVNLRPRCLLYTEGT